MLVSFCAVIGIGAIREYQEINSNEPQAGNKIKHIGKAINRSFKKHWKKGAILSSLTAATVFVVQLINRQSKRP